MDIQNKINDIRSSVLVNLRIFTITGNRDLSVLNPVLISMDTINMKRLVSIPTVIQNLIIVFILCCKYKTFYYKLKLTNVLKNKIILLSCFIKNKRVRLSFKTEEMIELKKPLVFFDLETTGTDVNKDRIVEIALVQLTPDGFRREFTSKVNPTIPIPKEASDVHGITNEEVCDKPTFKDICHEVKSYFDSSDIAGYNSDRFDMVMLIAEFARCGVYDFPSPETKVIDVFKIEQIVSPRTLSSVYKGYTGKDLDGAHGALADVNGTIEVFEAQQRVHDLPDNISDIEYFALRGEKRADFSGKLKYIDGVLCYSFGKNKDKPVANDLNYAKWMLGSDFPSDTKALLRAEMDKYMA